MRFGWRDRAGKLLETIGQPVEARSSFSLSPDGSRVAYTAGPGLGQTDIWVLELAGGLSTRVTFSNAAMAAMVARREAALLQQPKRNPPESGGWVWRGGVVDEGEPTDFVKSVSPDGKVLLYGNGDIMTLPLTGEGKPEAYLQTKYVESMRNFLAGRALGGLRFGRIRAA